MSKLKIIPLAIFMMVSISAAAQINASLLNIGNGVLMPPFRLAIDGAEGPMIFGFSAISGDVVPFDRNLNSPIQITSSISSTLPGTATGGTDGATPPPLPTAPAGPFPDDSAVGLPEEISWDIAVFPNPTDGMVYLEIEAGFVADYRLEVMDISGRRVEFRENIKAGTTERIDLSRVASGAYIMRLFSKNGDFYKTFKIVKSKF